MKKIILYSVIFFFTALIPLQLMAQNRIVQGKVTSAKDNQPLMGQTVKIKGTSQGTQTDVNGAFSISVTSSSILVFSGIGYISVEVPVGNQNNISVRMTEAAGNLNEVVVIGYGTQQRKEVTSAISTVKAADFNKGNITDVAQLLQGKVAGLTIAKAGGDPNGAYAIRLRGLSSVSQNTSPLIVIDGVSGADLNSVDPNDIASVDVLKDGSAAAIYGTRGSAGVILITTKKGVKGKTQVEYNAYTSDENVSRHIPLMDPTQFRATIKSLGFNNDFGANTDWIKAITRPGLSMTHDVSLSGGNDNTTYRASVNYRDIEGVAKTTGFDQLNARIIVTQKALNDKLKLTVIGSQTTRNSNIGWSQAFGEATSYNPTAPIYSSNPAIAQFGGYFQDPNVQQHYNPLAMLEQNSNNVDLQRLNLNLEAEYNPFKNFTLTGRYGYQKSNQLQTIFISKESDVDPRMINGNFGNGINFTGTSGNGIAAQDLHQSYNKLIEGTANYSFKVSSKLSGTALAGYSYQDFTNNGFSVAGGNIITDDLHANNFNDILDFQAGLGSINSFKNYSRLIAFFGRTTFNYDDTYFLTTSLRHEGSNTFGVNNKWGDFPSLGGAVDARKLIDLPVFSNLKFRGSYGITGALPDGPYYALSTLGANGLVVINGNTIQSFGPTQNANPNLKWERKAELNLGLDFSLLNDKLSGSIDYFDRITTDLLYYAPVPVPPNIASNTWVNVGKLTSKGVEVVLNYNAITATNFKWTTGINYATAKVIVNSLSSSQYQIGDLQTFANIGAPALNGQYAVRLKVGDPLGNLYAPVYDGVDANGMIKFKHFDGNPSNIPTEADYKVVGNGLPKFTAGWVNTFTYKNFDLNIFLRGAFGHSLLNSYRAFLEYPSVSGQFNVVDTKYYNPSLSKNQTLEYTSNDIEKADFVKLDNATFGYNFPIKGNSIIKRFRLYVSGQNLFTITGYTGIDPEPRFTDSEATGLAALVSPGIERRATWVTTRTISFGLNLGF